MLTKNYMVLLFVMVQMAMAMEVELGQYILDEGKLQTKSRYVYSDFKGSEVALKNATTAFDLGVYQINYEHSNNSSIADDDHYLRLYILMTTSEDLEKLQDIIEQNQEFLDQHNLTYSYLFKPMTFGFYNQLDLKSDIDDLHFKQFNESNQLKYKYTQQVKQEGVYYVSFIYETIDQFKFEKEKLYETKNKDWQNLDENLDYGEFKVGYRRQLYSHFKYKKYGTSPALRNKKNNVNQKVNNFLSQPHMILTGNIIFKNTHGYLSAQQYGNIQINAWLLITFTFLSILWSLSLFKYRLKLLPIHYMVSVVLYACFFECVFLLMLYCFENDSIGDYKGFWIFISFMEVIRSVFSRVIVLLTALGQHITKQSVGDKYLTNIGIVSIFYAISLMIAIIMQYMKDKYQISTPIIIAGELPNFIMNFLISVWIFLAFRKTLNTLNQSQQFQKSEVVMQMFLVYIVSLLLTLSIFIYDKLGRGDPDEDWQSMAVHLKSYFMIFVFLTISYSFILRPGNSKAAETFNQYRNLRVDDTQDGGDLNNTMPDCALNQSTEMTTDVQELDKSDP